MSKTRKVTIAAGEVTTKDGKSYKQGASPSLPDVEARDLIRAGLAREAVKAAEAPAAASTTTKGA